jgi:hypothetical protein
MVKIELVFQDVMMRIRTHLDSFLTRGGLLIWRDLSNKISCIIQKHQKLIVAEHSVIVEQMTNNRLINCLITGCANRA